jgi:hypothetical protein
MNIPQELLYQQYVRRELETYRAPYDPELEFYSYVRQGNTEKVKELCRESFQEKKGLGILSDSPLQNLKYHFAITAAMLARYCIEGGMEVTEQKNRDRSEYALPFRLCDLCNFYHPGVSQSKLFHISFPGKDRENTNAVSCRTLPHFRHPIKNRKCSYLCRAMAGEDLQDKTP